MSLRSCYSWNLDRPNKNQTQISLIEQLLIIFPKFFCDLLTINENTNVFIYEAPNLVMIIAAASQKHRLPKHRLACITNKHRHQWTVCHQFLLADIIKALIRDICVIVHICIYFISPSNIAVGRRLYVDVFLKRLLFHLSLIIYTCMLLRL